MFNSIETQRIRSWRLRCRWTSLVALAGLWSTGATQLHAQSTPVHVQTAVADPSKVISLDISSFREFLDSSPEDIPILIRHRQDPTALPSSESLSVAPRVSTPSGQTASNLAGRPFRTPRNQVYVSRSQNRSAFMIGDFFGGGSAPLTITRDVMDVVPFVSSGTGGADFNSFVGFNRNDTGGGVPVGPLYAAPGFPLLTSFGRDTNGDQLQDTFGGLQQSEFPNGPVEDKGPFQAVLKSGETVVVGGDTVFVLGLQQELTFDQIPNPSQGGVVGRIKIAENTSPMPRDRVFFNYSYFDNVPLTQNGININRFTPGFEKTIQDGNASVEFRAPFATTLGSNVSTSGISDGEELEFGNVSLTYKSLLYRDDQFALSGGLQVALPTADAVNVNLQDGTTLVRVKNQSVNLMPFVGALYTPDERFFSQAFLQFDFAANGNDVLANLDMTKLRRIGTTQDTSFAYLDWSAGYWSYLSDDPNAFLTGVAPTFELHMNQSMQHNDVIKIPGSIQLGTSGRNVSVLNAVIGTTFQFGSSSSMTVGYAAPLTGGSDRQFDGEFRLFFNRRFGPQTIQTRAY